MKKQERNTEQTGTGSTQGKANGIEHADGVTIPRDKASGKATEAVERDDPREEVLKRRVAKMLLEFVSTVEPKDFCYFVFILALGNRWRAADALGESDTVLYRRVEGWANRGPVYQRMLALITSQKLACIREEVPLSLSLQSGERDEEAENPDGMDLALHELIGGEEAERDYLDLLREVMGALKEMKPTNWSSIRDELVGLLEEEGVGGNSSLAERC